ncbi:MAG TPA: SH3 domain-containing protein [Anaerolineae bacterium]|nr:SH3 domain-containing protein [Anaerolineae bacterium]
MYGKYWQKKRRPTPFNDNRWENDGERSDEFNGSEAEFAQYLSQPAKKPDRPAKPAPSPKQSSPRLTGRIIAAQLNVRAGPGLNYDIVDTLKPGDKVEVFDVNGRDAWIKIGPDRWTAVTINGNLFLEIE